MIKFDKPAPRLFCENCNKFVDYEVILKEDIYNVRGEEIKIKAKIPVCKVCGGELFDIHLEDENLREAYRMYAKKHGLVLPEEIKNIRENYGLSQETFARILGIGRATLARYENGSLPSEAISSLIKRSKDPNFLLSLVEERKDSISKSDYERIKRKLERKIVPKTLKEFEKLFEALNEGNINFQKLYGIVAYILQKLREQGYKYITKVKLMKLLWFVDKGYSKQYGRSISGLTYAHLPLGPAPHYHDTLLELLETAGVITVEREINENDSETIKIELKDETFERYINEREKKILDEILQKYGLMNTSDLIKKSHEDEIWKSTKDGEKMIL
ncbi:transcriptional regulator, XRE family [Thermotoga petrophila RKU-10]|jgi:putative zinc finger/helix-turn-helix YgiT family protein|uniref:Transcriptional regulator, XRE family n=2 Tax=Thermotoga petrophila TaxID=93929 RepID=D2C8D5_THEP2|nr:type II TA system antitoxin MqsA family protein [Thermotoga petrophila]ADA67221.1 transcriptional regulator, XRE family [Thermotoga petrophila RKU-10]KUK22612.1 MAG: Transcriptional regulator, XRE family [Thermotoga petrophila]HAA83073.1 DUF4065 domain-containing protein [Thermotoga petrophila]